MSAKKSANSNAAPEFQMAFSQKSRKYSEENLKNLESTARSIFADLQNRVKNRKILTDLMTGRKELESRDLHILSKPETVTREVIIQPLLKCLGYADEDIISESGQDVESERRWIDYQLAVDNSTILIEAEHLGSDLWAPKKGVNQVKGWIMAKSVDTDYGIATDGFQWILLKYDKTARRIEDVDDVSLLPVFARKAGFDTFEEVSDKGATNRLKKLYLTFAKENILLALNENLLQLEKKKDEISKKFYSQYMEFVFGEVEGSERRPYSLMTTIISPSEVGRTEVSLFAITFMNRLFFIKFLEDKGLVHSDFLATLWKEYKSKLNMPVSFYKSYLEPLFFNVFNTPPDQRSADITKVSYFKPIPYLNGGLFRAGHLERAYDIQDDILDSVINNLLSRYSFSISGRTGELDPAILGNVFEKTVNYIAEPGETSQQKLKGAYYTPDDTTSYITKEVLHPFLLSEIITKLKKLGWKEPELKEYVSLEALLDNPPHSSKDVRRALEIVENVTILDPACGSGHFLSTALNELLYIRERLLKLLGQEYDTYDIKREIISNNLYGVDIEEPAIEIAKLRLWLSLIENLETKDSRKIKTLPNIEFNLLSGDSLNGWLDESVEQQTVEPISNVDNELDQLEKIYAEDKEKLAIVTELRNVLSTNEVNDILTAYSSLRRMYPFASLKVATTISSVLNKIRNAINELVKRSLISSRIEEESTGSIKKKKLLREKLVPILRLAFNWKVNFYDIIEKGGFDIVIGNPPYVESTANKVELFGEYLTANCGNTHAYFMERSLKLVKTDGYVGFIVPVSAVSTPRMATLQQLLVDAGSQIRISNYDDRPGKIFSDLEHCRSSIILVKRKAEDEDEARVFTTTYNRWKTEDRPKLFNSLEYTEATNFIASNSIPKIGKKIEKAILEKLGKKRPFNKFKIEEPATTIWYHNAPQYWIRAQDFVPYFKSEREGVKISSHLHEIKITRKHAKPLMAILNSSLFYWYFVVYSNGRDLTNREIDQFPMSLDKMDDGILRDLSKVVDNLMADYKKNSKRKEIHSRKTGKVVYDEFYPGLSKSIMDKIDDILAEYYGFTDEELDFIENYSVGFRLGGLD